MTRQQIHAILTKDEAQVEQQWETWIQQDMISCIFNPRGFSERLISAVKIATAYREDVNKWSNETRASSIISNERHSIAMPEELEAQLWNIGIQTAKDTVRVTTHKGIRTAIHPMTSDKAHAGRSSAAPTTPAATSGNMVYQHVVVEGQVETWKHMRQCLHTREIYQEGGVDDVQKRCRKVFTTS
jgi:hypothetical protein